MSENSVTATVRILDKEYRVSCEADEQRELEEAARVLDENMRSIRGGGKVIGLERIAVMAALNIAHDMLLSKNQSERADEAAGKQVRGIIDKIDHVLEVHRQLEL